MNNQLARSLFMDYLYDEIASEDKKRLEAYLKEHPELQKELDRLQQTRSLLLQMPEEQPSQKLLVMEPRKRTFSQWLQEAGYLMPQSFLGKTGLAIAAGFVLLMVIGSVTKVHVSTVESGFSISLGYQPVINEGLSVQQTEALIDQIRRDNAAMLADYAGSLNSQNEQQLRQLVQYFEQQRMNDLQLIDQNLTQLQQANSYRWQQANRYLGEVLQNVSLNGNE